MHLGLCSLSRLLRSLPGGRLSANELGRWTQHAKQASAAAAASEIVHVEKPVIQFRDRYVEVPAVTVKEQIVEVPVAQEVEIIRQVGRRSWRPAVIL